MGRNLVVAILFLYAVPTANAQLLLGPVLGGAISKASFFDTPNNSSMKSIPTLGLDGGVMVSMRVRKNFYLNAQLLYAYRSKHIEGSNGAGRSDNQTNITSDMRYIELPIFYVLEFKNLSTSQQGRAGQVKAYNWFIGAGPTISYWLSDKGTLRSSYLKENFIDKINYTSVFGRDNSTFDAKADANKESISSPNRFQFAINITGGLAFEPLGLNRIVTTMSINIAQTFLAKTDGFYPGSNVDADPLRIKNHNIRFSVAYLIDTKIEKSKKGKSSKGKGVRR